MKLDESIELMNKTKNIKQMENMSNQHMRSMMEEMALDEAMKGCMYEVLTMEGFLPETLSEGETYEGVMSAMMEDDEIMAEMYKACSMNESDCGTKMESWMNEKLVGGQKELDKNNDGKIDASDFEMMRKEKGVEKNEDEMYEGKHPEGEHYKNKISLICKDLADINKMMANDDELPAWIQDKLAVMYHSADAIKSYLHGDKSVEMNESDDYDDTESPTYLLNKKRVLDQEISRYSNFVNKFIPMIDKLDAGDVMAYFQPQGEFSIEGFKDFLTKKEEESSLDYYEKLNQIGDFMYRSIFDALVNPRKRGFFNKHGNKLGIDTLETIEDVLSDIFDMGNSIYVKKKEIEKIDGSIENRSEKEPDNYGGGFDDDDMVKPKLASKGELDVLSADDLTFDDMDDDDDMLEEVSYPIKGKNVDSENKSNSNKENTEATKDAEDSQETTQEKIDNLKNQKYELSDGEQSVKDKMFGMGNNLDLSYSDELSKETKNRIVNSVTSDVPDHANVDHDSKVGEKLINATKSRADYLKANYTSKPDRTSIEQEDEFLRNTAVQENLDRIKNLFKYEDELISENRKKVTNEDELLFKQVSTKKFI